MKDVLDKVVLKIYRLVFKEEPTIVVNTFVKNLTFVGIGFGVSAVLGLVTQIMAGRILGPLEYGKYFLIQAVSSFLCLPMLVGVNTALIKYSAGKDDFFEKKKIISTSYSLFISFSAIILTILFVFSQTLSKLFGVSSELFIYAVIFSFFYSFYTISISIAQGLKEMKTLSILQIIYGIGGIVAFLALIFLKVFSFKAILFASLTNYLIVSILSIIIFHKYLSFGFEKKLVKNILRYGLYASIGAVSYIVCFNFDRITINRFFGSAQVGIYGAYYLAFITSAALIFNTFNLVFFPMVSSIKDKAEVFKKVNKIIIRLSIFVLFFVLFMGIIVMKLYGGKYQLNLWFCLLFTMASIFSLLNAIYFWCVSAMGENGIKVTSIAAVAAAIINIIINLLLIPVLGFLGGIIGITFSYIVSIVIIFWQKNILHLVELHK